MPDIYFIAAYFPDLQLVQNTHDKSKYNVTSNQCIHIHAEGHKHDYKSNQMDYKRNGCILCRTGHIVKPVQYGICDRGPAVQHYNDSSKHEKIGRRCT